MRKFSLIVFTLLLLLALPTCAFAAESDGLSSLTLREGYAEGAILSSHPAFSNRQTDYYLFLPNGSSTQLYVEAQAAPGCSIYLDGQHAAAAGTTLTKILPLSGGDNHFTLQAGSRVYHLHVYYALHNAAATTQLSQLEIRTLPGDTSAAAATALSLNPSFSPNTYHYTCTIDSSVTDLYFAVSSVDPYAHLFVNDVYIDNRISNFFHLGSQGGGTFTVQVIAADCQETRTYTIDVYRESTTTLDQLRVYAADGTQIAISPAFRQEQSQYQANVPATTSQVSFFLNVSSSNEQLQIHNTTTGESRFVNNNSRTPAFRLASGLNCFQITLNNGAQRTQYTLYLYRQASKPEISISSWRVSVNGKTAQPLSAYNIEGNHFIKLRDLAMLLRGSNKAFSIGYDPGTNQVLLARDGVYTPIGGELSQPGRYQYCLPSPQSLYLDGEPVAAMAYNIDGSNYLMLRDLALLFDFSVDAQSSTKTVRIDTHLAYQF